jgi:cobalt-zinc-cadmium efflux system outer membrane protein
VLAAATLVLYSAARPSAALQGVSRTVAHRAALAFGARFALAGSDTAAARAALITARALPNPSLNATYSRSAPQKHLILDVPVDAPWSRGPRIGAANATARAARLRYLSERTAALIEVDTTYTAALAAQARFRLSLQTAHDADSLRTMTAARRDAGDASDLDVDLATITAGQHRNAAATDSLTYMSSVLTVQTLMGLAADSTAIELVDSLRLAPVATDAMLRELDSAAAILMPRLTLAASPATLSSATPSVAAAEAALVAAELAVTRERRSIFGLPSVQAGVEWGDASEDPPNKLLPTVGISIPLPLFNRNGGAIAQARAERDRARAELAFTRLLVTQRLVEGQRERESLRIRVARDQALVASAERVAARSLTAYREGASALPAVLEARRTAREVLGQYIDDLAALLTIESELRALTQTVPLQ